MSILSVSSREFWTLSWESSGLVSRKGQTAQKRHRSFICEFFFLEWKHWSRGQYGQSRTIKILKYRKWNYNIGWYITTSSMTQVTCTQKTHITWERAQKEVSFQDALWPTKGNKLQKAQYELSIRNQNFKQHETALPGETPFKFISISIHFSLPYHSVFLFWFGQPNW